ASIWTTRCWPHTASASRRIRPPATCPAGRHSRPIIQVCSAACMSSGSRNRQAKQASDACIRIGHFYSPPGSSCGEKLMINITPIFINFLAVDSLRLNNERIEKFCLERKKKSVGRVISNGGGWQSDNLDPAPPELAELFAEIQKRLDDVHRAFEF